MIPGFFILEKRHKSNGYKFDACQFNPAGLAKFQLNWWKTGRQTGVQTQYELKAPIRAKMAGQV